MPNDLDFVVRIDLGRMRNEPSLTDAARDLAKRAQTGMLRSMLPALEQSPVVYVGARFMSDGFRGDGVVAIEPPAGGFDRQASFVDASFRPKAGAPRGVSVFERSTDARDEAVLEVVLDRGGIVLATAAEADAVLRIVRTRPDEDRLDPPAHGLASFAGRSTATAIATATATTTATSPFLRLLTRGLARYGGSIETSDALVLEAELIYLSQDDQEQSTRSIRSLLARLAEKPGMLQSMADSAKLAAEGTTLRLRATVPFAVLAHLH